MIKVIVDGFFLSEQGRSRVGGIFQNHETRILLHFGKQIRVDSAIYAEVLVIYEGLFVATASYWENSSFALELDSKKCRFVVQSGLFIRKCV